MSYEIDIWVAARRAGGAVNIMAGELDMSSRAISFSLVIIVSTTTKIRETMKTSCGGRILFFLSMMGIVTIDSLAPSRLAPHPRGIYPSVHKQGQTPVFGRFRGSQSQFAAFPSSSPSSSSSSSSSLAMSMSATSGAIASLRSSLHANNSFVLSALLVVSSCGIAMEQRTTFGKALSVSRFIVEFFNPYPMRVNL